MCCPFDTGDWLLQNPLLYGYAAVNAYLPSEQIAIAVAVADEEDQLPARMRRSLDGETKTAVHPAFI